MESQNTDHAPQTEKKKYATPELIVYGSISELTANVTDMGTINDNPVKKT
ncbi:MAG: hypothetical protein QOG23_3497 [Blastocatellia bacterium]|jgi:hypothetical protein|nr:hypothetical protein [Blastocatellia bacterium]